MVSGWRVFGRYQGKGWRGGPERNTLSSNVTTWFPILGFRLGAIYLAQPASARQRCFSELRGQGQYISRLFSSYLLL